MPSLLFCSSSSHMATIESLSVDAIVANVLGVLVYGGTSELLQRLMDGVTSVSPIGRGASSLSSRPTLHLREVMPETAAHLRTLLSRERERVLADHAAQLARMNELQEELAAARAALAAVAQTRATEVCASVDTLASAPRGDEK